MPIDTLSKETSKATCQPSYGCLYLRDTLRSSVPSWTLEELHLAENTYLREFIGISFLSSVTKTHCSMDFLKQI